MTFSNPRVRRIAIGGALAVVVVVVYLFIVYSGTVTVAATGPQSALNRFIDWTLDTTKDHSVRHHAKGITAPDLSDPEMVKMGFEHYQEMCVSCHGAPGVSPDELAEGLNPSPPKLVEAVNDWTPGELFWIVKYGIKMTGMPGFGPTHSDKKIWAMVAFLKQLPALSPEQYRTMRQAAGTGDEDEEHEAHEHSEEHE